MVEVEAEAVTKSYSLKYHCRLCQSGDIHYRKYPHISTHGLDSHYLFFIKCSGKDTCAICVAKVQTRGKYFFNLTRHITGKLEAGVWAATRS